MDLGTTPRADGQAFDEMHFMLLVQMTMKELITNVNEVERKMDFVAEKMISLDRVEQTLSQIKQQQLFTKMDVDSYVPSLVDIDGLLQKNLDRVRKPEGQDELLKRVDHGITELLSKHASRSYLSASSGAPLQQDEEMRHMMRHMDQELELLAKNTAAKEETTALLQTAAEKHDAKSQIANRREGIGVQPQGTGYLAEFSTHLLHSLETFKEHFMADLRGSPAGAHHAQSHHGLHLFEGHHVHSHHEGAGPGPPDVPGIDERHVDRPKGGYLVDETPEADILKPTEEEDAEEDVVEQQMVLKESGSLNSVFSCDDDVENPPYNVENFYYTCGINQCIAKSLYFEHFTVGVVVFNAVYIGVDSDYNDAQNIYKAHIVFQICSQFFAVYFTWELLTRFFAFEVKRNCLKDGWFKFDAFLVSTMIFDTWILMPTLYLIGGGVMIPTQPLRMLRLFKLTRMARLMKAFPELVTMIKGLVRSLRAISSSMILIGLMVYVWAIMMHMLMKEEKEFNQKLWDESMLNFATITNCIWILIMDGTLMLDNSAPLMTHLLFSSKFTYVLAGFLFVAYAMLSAMLILQMLIGVLCDVVSRVGQEERDAIAIGLVKQELLQDLKQYDDGKGKITQAQLAKVMNNPSSKALLKKLNINRVFLLELQKMMFLSVKEVSIKAVMELMIMCQGDNPTTVETMAGGILSLVNELTEVKRIIETDIADLARGIRKRDGTMSRHHWSVNEEGIPSRLLSEPALAGRAE